MAKTTTSGGCDAFNERGEVVPDHALTFRAADASAAALTLPAAFDLHCQQEHIARPPPPRGQPVEQGTRHPRALSSIRQRNRFPHYSIGSPLPSRRRYSFDVSLTRREPVHHSTAFLLKVRVPRRKVKISPDCGNVEIPFVQHKQSFHWLRWLWFGRCHRRRDLALTLR